MPTGDAHSSGHLGLAYVILVDTNPFRSFFFCVFRTMHFEHPSVLSRLCFTILDRHAYWYMSEQEMKLNHMLNFKMKRVMGIQVRYGYNKNVSTTKNVITAQ